MLASISFDSGTGFLTFDADGGEADIVSVSSPGVNSLQIQVGNGDSIQLQDDAVGNTDFLLSQNDTVDDTLTINVAGSAINQLTFNLLDLNDMFTATGFLNGASLIVTGGTGDDVIDGSTLSEGVNFFGSAGNDTLTGGSGNDVLGGGGGTDIIAGGAGFDTNSFQGIGVGVTATVNAAGDGTANYAAVNETFSGIENLTGSENDDVLIATGTANNVLLGQGGNDVIAGGGGTDVINGGEGIDTNSFSAIGIPITAVINDDGTGTATYGNVSESFVSIENLTGSANDDTLTGNSSANVIDGGRGNDTILGLGGDDVLFGGSGNDDISGGNGNDRLVGGFGDDVINGDEGNDSLIGSGQIEITLTNLQEGDGALLTPVFVATQNGVYDFFDVGGTASASLESLAEDGATGARIAEALASGGVGQAVATANGPIAPGESRTITLFADPTDPNTQFLSYATMVIPSNDAFIGNDDPTQFDLFDDDGNLITRTGSNAFVVTGDEVLDAGTEVNDEVPANTAALAQSSPNTGVTEGGLIRQHEGFQGSDRLGGDIGNILAARPDADFTLPGANVLQIEVGSAAEETGFAIELNDQPLESLTDSQTPADLIVEAANDNLYFNVHTNDFPGGEIRGQLLLQSDNTVDGVRTLILTASLDAAQEPDDASDSLATGEGTVTITDDGSEVTYASTLSVDGIATSELLPVLGFSSIHIHNAPAGTNGNVITDIVQGAGGDINGDAVNPIFDTGDGDIFEEAFESDNDTLSGGAGDDTISGGDGEDLIIGGAGNDTLFGGVGDDVINGGAGNDTINAGAGDDFILGVGGVDIIDGGSGNDTNSFQGIGLGVNATVFEDGTGIANYGSVNESFSGIENLTGSSNDDVLSAQGDFDSILRGFEGNDILTGSSGDDLLIGDAGDDILRGANGADRAIGGEGNDTLNGGGGDDFLNGGAGDDFLLGIGGTDLILGGEGFDTNSFQNIGLGVTARINDNGTGNALYGAVVENFAGIERLVGSDNDDTLIATGSVAARFDGLGGDDLLIGGFGVDVLNGGTGNDTINGRGGNDLLFGQSGDDTISGGAGDDFIRGDEGDDTISGQAGNDRLVGSEGDDFIFGNDGLDFVFGALGADSIFGGDDDDELLGGVGDDLLVGGLGEDVLNGGLGENQLIQ